MKKIISLIVTICFVISSLNNVLFASNNFEQNLLPQNLGNISYSNICNPNNIVINIQDLHANAKVQKNINNILKYLSSKNNIKSIYLEGASNKVDVSWLKDLPTKDKLNTSNLLLDIGILTGTEYFTINSSSNISLYGLENKKIHQDNIENLSILIKNEQFIKEKLSSIKKDLTILNNKFVNSQNRKFAKLINNYKSKKINTLEFYSKLLEYVKKISANSDKYNNLVNLTIDDYPNILAFKEILSLEAEINKTDLNKELQVLLTIIKDKLSKEEFNKFLSLTDNATNLSNLISYIAQFCTANNLNLEKDYPNINLTLAYQLKSQNINFVNLTKEQNRIISNIKTALSYNLKEYEITFLNDFYIYLENALTNNLMAKDYDYFANSINKFKLLYPKYVIYNQLKDIQKYIDISKDFYKINNERNSIFVENLKKDLNTNSKDKNIIVLVTGGYHTKGLSELLSKQNISFITVTPQLNNLTDNSNIYKDIIRQESNEFNKNTIAFTIASQMKDITFIQTLISAGLKNKVPFQQIKQICQNIFKDTFVADDDVSFTIKISGKAITISQENGYAVFDSNLDTDKIESLSKDLSIFASDINSKNNKLNIKFLLNLLNVINNGVSFDIISLTKQNDLLQSITKTLVFLVEEMNIQFSNGFEEPYIEEYVNELAKNGIEQVDGININTARFLPKIIQSILYENDKASGQVDKRLKDVNQGIATDEESSFLAENFKEKPLQIGGLLSGIVKDILDYINSEQPLDPTLRNFFNQFVNISEVSNYISAIVFNLGNQTKGISLGNGLIGITSKLQFPGLMEAIGHEFAHEMLLRLKTFEIREKTESVAHETHSYLFSILFAQIFNNMISSTFINEQDVRDYDKFLLDLNSLYTDTITRNLTQETQSMNESNNAHISALNFINMLNRLLGKDGKIMDLQNLMYLTESIREVFLMDKFKDFSYSSIFYAILMELAKKLNPNATDIINKYYTQIINTTKFFTTDEQDGNLPLIETFTNIIFTGTSEQIENFIQDKIIIPELNFDDYKDIIRDHTKNIKTSPKLHDIIDEIIFVFLKNKVVLLKDSKPNKNIKVLTSEIIKQIKNFVLDYNDLFNIPKSLLKLLTLLKNGTIEIPEDLTPNNIGTIFMKALSYIGSDSSLLKLESDTTYIYKAINEVLPIILQKHNKIMDLESVVKLILNPTIYQNIDIAKEILKTKNDLEETIDILIELFTTIVKGYNISFNEDVTNPIIKEYIKDKQTVSQVPISIFIKLPSFIQEILYNEETSTITKSQNDFTYEYYLQNKNGTNSLLKLILQDLYAFFKSKEYELSIPSTDILTIFAGRIPSGVSNGNFIAINPKDESFLNVIAHELGHILLTNAGFSHYNSVTVHELYAYTMGLLATTAYNDETLETEKLLPASYDNFVNANEHSLPKTLLQFITDIYGKPLTEQKLISILQACKVVLQNNVSNMDNISLTYQILKVLEEDQSFMKGFLPNELTIKFEKLIDEPEERKNKIMQQLFNVELKSSILIVEKEVFLNNTEESPIFIDRKIINKIFDANGDIIPGQETAFYYLQELVRLQIHQQYDLTKAERVDDFESFYNCFNSIQSTLQHSPFDKYCFTFKKEVDGMILKDKELIYIDPEFIKIIGRSKYSQLLNSLLTLRFLENKFNKEFNTTVHFDFYVTVDNLDNIPIDFQKFSNTSNVYDLLKEAYAKYSSKQQVIDQAIEKILTKNKVRDKKLFTEKIRNLIFIVDNPNIKYTSIEFFKELSSNVNHSTMEQIYANLIEIYSFLIRNNLLVFNSSFNEEITNYINSSKVENLDGIELDTAVKMPSFIQQLLYKNMMTEQIFSRDPEFIKASKYKSDKLNGLLNVIAEDIVNIVATIYPNLDKDILSAQVFLLSLQRLTDGANFGNSKIAISSQLINRYQNDPKALIIEILKTISHELGHEELFLRGVTANTNLINTLHELYAYLFETLLIKSYSKFKGIKETESVFSADGNIRFIDKIIDQAFVIASILKDLIIGVRDEHDQALDILEILQRKEYQSIFPKEKIIETLDIIESFAKGIQVQDDNITKTLRVDDLNMQAVSFFLLVFMFAGEFNITESQFIELSKALTVCNFPVFEPKEVIELCVRNKTSDLQHLISTILIKGKAKTEEINKLLFDNKTFENNGKTYGYSITTNRSENGLIKDDKVLIYFTPSEIKVLATTDSKKMKAIKRKANILTENISENLMFFTLSQNTNILSLDKPTRSIKKVLKAPIQRALATGIFVRDLMQMCCDLLRESVFKNSKSINVVYYDDYNIIDPRADILSVYICTTEPHETTFELTDYTINGRNLRISHDTKNNFILAYCPQASKQEIIEMTSQYIKSNISNQNNINLKNIIVSSDVLPDTITYHLSQENEGFTCISTSFMEFGVTFIEELLKVDDIESVMFSKQIYDYIGTISFKQLLKILQDKYLGDNKIIIDSDVFTNIILPNQIMLKSFLKTTQLEIIVKVNSQKEMDQIYNTYGLTNYMLETKTDNITTREIVEYSTDQGSTHIAPVSFIELTDLSNLEDKLETIPSHQAIVISINTDSAKNIDISNNMILSSLKTTITKILKSKTISIKTAKSMGTELAKQITITEDEKEKLANQYNSIKKALTSDNITQLINDYPNIFTSQVQAYIEKLFDENSEEINETHVAFIENLLDTLLYDDNLDKIQVDTIKVDEIKYYKNLLSAA